MNIPYIHRWYGTIFLNSRNLSRSSNGCDVGFRRNKVAKHNCWSYHCKLGCVFCFVFFLADYHKSWGMFQNDGFPQKSDCLILESCMLLLKNCLKQPNKKSWKRNRQHTDLESKDSTLKSGSRQEGDLLEEGQPVRGLREVTSLTLVGLVIARHEKLPSYMWITPR